MASTIVVTIAIGAGDPPGNTLDAHADGRPLFVDENDAPKTIALDPPSVLALGTALEQASGETGIQATLRAMMQPVADALAAQVAEDQTRQQERSESLAAWREALGQQEAPT